MAEGTNVFRGRQSALNVTGSVVVKPGNGRVGCVVVNTAGAAATLNDSATVGGAAAGNLIFAIPNTVGVYPLDFPFYNGLTLIGGAGVFALTYD